MEEKVHKMEDYKQRDSEKDLAPEIAAKTQGDISKAALFLALLAIIVSIIFFFALQREIGGVSESLAQRSAELVALDARVSGVDSRVASMGEEVNTRLSEINNQVDTQLTEMGSKVDQGLSDLGGQVQSVALRMNSAEDRLDTVNVRLGGFENRMAELEKLPQRTRNMMIARELETMAQQIMTMGGALENEEANAKLEQAKQLMGEVQQGLDQ
jgi:predicted  nucleic acid-binding Zn-ribbon protein